MVCVHDFPCGEVSVKVGIIEFWLYWVWPSAIKTFHYGSCFVTQTNIVKKE